jgi:hypothetical protein
MKGNEIITIRSDALMELVKLVVEQVTLTTTGEIWVSSDRAKEILNISSSSYLSYLRSNGLIEYSQPSKKHLVYHKPSLLEYLEKHKQNKF